MAKRGQGKIYRINQPFITPRDNSPWPSLGCRVKTTSQVFGQTQRRGRGCEEKHFICFQSSVHHQKSTSTQRCIHHHQRMSIIHSRALWHSYLKSSSNSKTLQILSCIEWQNEIPQQLNLEVERSMH